MFYILGPLYISKEILVDFAELQGANIYLTRETDTELLRNAPLHLRAIPAGLYFLLLSIGLAIGLLTGEYFTGASVLAGDFFLPVLLLRLYNTKFRSNALNRDELMAKKIVDAAKENDTVLAVVGFSHAEGIIESLPETLELCYHPPEYGRISKQHLKETLVPVFQMFSYS